MMVAALESVVEAGAQALFRGGVPLAVGVDAVDEDHDAGQRRRHEHIEIIHITEQGDAGFLAEDNLDRIVVRIDRGDRTGAGGDLVWIAMAHLPSIWSMKKSCSACILRRTARPYIRSAVCGRSPRPAAPG